MADFEERWSEGGVRNLTIKIKDTINVCKNQLHTALAEIESVKADDKARLQLNKSQTDVLLARKDKAQAIYDFIIAQGF